MAHFIGSVQGGRGKATRLGHPAIGISAKVASYQGGCKVSMYIRDGQDRLRIELVPHCGAGESGVIYDGPLSEAHLYKAIRAVHIA